MASTKKTVFGVAGAGLLAIASTFGINTYNGTAPIPVKASLCEKGKLATPVTYQGKTYAKGQPCTPVVAIKKKH
jgi:hypothetical protein